MKKERIDLMSTYQKANIRYKKTYIKSNKHNVKNHGKVRQFKIFKLNSRWPSFLNKIVTFFLEFQHCLRQQWQLGLKLSYLSNIGKKKQN